MGKSEVGSTGNCTASSDLSRDHHDAISSAWGAGTMLSCPLRAPVRRRPVCARRRRFTPHRGCRYRVVERRRPAASPARPAHATTRPPAIATTAPSIPESSDGIESHRRTQQNKFNKRNVITPIISTIPITLTSPIIPITPIIPIK